MEIRIRLPKKTMMIGEEAPVEVELVNVSSTPVTVPVLNDPYARQPYFVISGGALEKPQRFHWRGSEPRGVDPPRDTATLAPRQSLHGVLNLPISMPVTQEGEYQLYATYEFSGTTAESNHVSLKIMSPGFTVFRVVGQTPLRSLLGIQSLAVGGSTLYLASFVETRPEIGETEFTGISPIAELEPGATDFFSPWRQTAEPGPVTPRFGWRAGNRITVAGFRKLPQSVEMPFTPRIHPPSLMNAKGDIDVLVTDPSGLEIALVRFPQTQYNVTPPPAAVVWKHTVKAPVSALTASINPTGEKAAVVRQGSSVSLMRWTDAGPSFEGAATVEGTPVAQVAPAIHITGSGVIRASILTKVDDTGAAGHLALSEFRWAPHSPGTPAVGAKSAPFELPAPIRSGSVAYSMSAVESPQREWFFVLTNGRVFNSRTAGKARTTKLVVPEPPQLVIMSAAQYCIVVAEKPRLVMLE